MSNRQTKSFKNCLMYVGITNVNVQWKSKEYHLSLFFESQMTIKIFKLVFISNKNKIKLEKNTNCIKLLDERIKIIVKRFNFLFKCPKQ